MKKLFALAILLGIVWLGLAILFPNKNKSVVIKEPNYTTLFNDQNGVQLQSAVNHRIYNQLLLNILRVISQKYGHNL